MDDPRSWEEMKIWMREDPARLKRFMLLCAVSGICIIIILTALFVPFIILARA